MLCSVIGIVVVCGPIRTRFVYSMDDLVENGANMMIEVMRQAFHDLGALLADYNGKSYNMPKTTFLQFDNCGVNKVSITQHYNMFIFIHYIATHVESIHVRISEFTSRKRSF